MNKSKRLTHYMTVSPIAFRHNLRLSPTPAHAQPRGIRTYRREPLAFHGVLALKPIAILTRLRIQQPYGLRFGCPCHEGCSMKRKSTICAIRSLPDCVMTRMRERLSKNTQGRREPDVIRRGPFLVQSANPNQLVYLPRPHRGKKPRGILTERGKVIHPELRHANATP
jgi:hypothetical protein